MRHFLCRLFVVLMSVCVVPTVVRAVECTSGQYIDGENCVACPGLNSNSHISYSNVTTIKSDDGATSASQCYFEVTKNSSTGYSNQQVTLNGLGRWYVEYSPGAKCYWNDIENAYSDCTQMKFFTVCNIGSFVDNSVALNDGFRNRCTICAAGTYGASNAGDAWTPANACTVCPAGSTSPAGASRLDQCVPCADGTYLTGGECAACPAGVTCVAGVMTCENGKFLNGMQCESCPADYPFSAPDATSIGECYLVTESGTYVAEPQGAPVQCAVGDYCPGGMNVYYGYGRYRAVEYIQSDGNAYIDTGIVTRPEYEYRVRSTIMGATRGQSRSLLGARISSNSVKNAFVLMSSTNEGAIRYDRFGTGDFIYPANRPVLRDGLFHDLKMTTGTSGGLFIDGTKISSNKTSNNQIGTYPVLLFGVNTGGSVILIDFMNKIKSYTVLDTNTDTIVQNFVAVYDSATDTYGMYETLTNTFYGNAGGAGTFSGGDFIGTEYLGNIGGNYSCLDATAGLSASSPAGATSAAECGRILHLGGGKILLLHGDKRTSPSLVVRYGKHLFYGDMTPNIRRGYLRTRIGDNVYSIYNMDIDE